MALFKVTTKRLLLSGGKRLEAGMTAEVSFNYGVKWRKDLNANCICPISEINDLFDRDCLMNLPVSFRVIGIGEDTADIIKTVKSFGYDCVSATVITNTFECIPTDEDKLVIIVAKDNDDHANSIAKTFHDAGILTLGLLDNANLDCFDSVASEASYTEYSNLIKEILYPYLLMVDNQYYAVNTVGR